MSEKWVMILETHHIFHKYEMIIIMKVESSSYSIFGMRGVGKVLKIIACFLRSNIERPFPKIMLQIKWK